MSFQILVVTSESYCRYFQSFSSARDDWDCDFKNGVHHAMGPSAVQVLALLAAVNSENIVIAAVKIVWSSALKVSTDVETKFINLS